MIQTLFVISVSDAKPDSFLRIDSFPQLGSTNRFIVSLSHLAVMSVYIYFLTTQSRFISVKHSNKLNGVKVSFVYLSYVCGRGLIRRYFVTDMSHDRPISSSLHINVDMFYMSKV